MVYYDHLTKNLIERIPSDSKIKLKETYTGLTFLTTPYEILNANNILNKTFSKTPPGYVTILDVLMAFGLESGLLNDAPDLTGLLYGWNWLCFFGYEQPWIVFWVGVEETSDELIFTLSYDVDPCKEYRHCNGESCYFAC